MYKTFKRFLLIAFVTSLPLSGCASVGRQPQNKAEVVMRAGDQVDLFYGGEKEASAIFCPGETVTVFRQEPLKRLRYVEQGKVLITRVLDENYVEGRVLEGNVKPGYVARKGDRSCLVTPPQQKGSEQQHR